MDFGSPQILPLLLAIPALALWLAWRLAVRRRRLSALGESALVARLTPGLRPGVPGVRAALWTVALALGLTALARPQYGEIEESVATLGVDVIVAVDTSLSMFASDTEPMRMARAQAQAEALIQSLRGTRMGLISFAGGAVLQTPLTSDTGALLETLEVTDLWAVGDRGTALADAVRLAVRSYEEDSPRHRVLILITDGEDFAGEVDEAAELARDAEVTIHTVGVGTETGARVPEINMRGDIIGLRDDVTRLEPDTLRELAEETGGRAFLSTETGARGGAETDTLAREILALPGREMEDESVTRRAEQFQLFLLPAVLILLLEPLLSDASARRRRQTLVGGAAALTLTLTAALGAHAQEVDPVAIEENNEGVRLHRRGELGEASERYIQAEIADPDNPEVLLNLGALRAEEGDLEGAIERFTRAAQTAEGDLATAALYNLGTAQMMRAEEIHEDGEDDPGLSAIGESIESLRSALVQDPDSDSARHNLELAMGLQRQWMQQQPPPSPSQSQQDQSDDESEEDQEQDQQGESEETRQQQAEDQQSQQSGEQGEPQEGDQQQQSDSQESEQGEEQEDQQQSDNSEQQEGEQQQTDSQQDEGEQEESDPSEQQEDSSDPWEEREMADAQQSESDEGEESEGSDSQGNPALRWSVADPSDLENFETMTPEEAREAVLWDELPPHQEFLPGRIRMSEREGDNRSRAGQW